MVKNYVFLELGDVYPGEMAEKPFAVLLDAHSGKWLDSKWAESEVALLLDYGCRFFTCYGQHAEYLHDFIDEMIENRDDLSIITTFHADDSDGDIAIFFKSIAMHDLDFGMVVVSDVNYWEKLFGQ